MKTKKTIKIVALSLVALFLFLIIGLYSFSKEISQQALATAGFKKATIERAHFGLNGTTLTNVVLDPENGSKIGRIDFYATFGDMLAFRLGKIVVSDVVINLPLDLPASQEKSLGALNLFTKEIQFQNVVVHLPTPYGDLPLALNGSIVDRGAEYQASGTFDTATDYVNAAGQATVALDKATRAVKAHVELAEAKATIPNVDIRRATGWIDAALPHDAGLPQISAQLTFGAVKAYGLPLQGMTLSASSEKNKTEVLLNGQVANNSGEINVDATLDQTDAATDKISANADVRLTNLDALGLQNIKGRGNFTLAAAGEKDRAAAFDEPAAWRKLAGDMTVAASKLTLPGLLDQLEANARAQLAFDPSTRALKLDAEKASFSSTSFTAKDLTAHITAYLQKYPVAEGKVEIGEIAHKAKPAYIVPSKVSFLLQPLSSQQNTTGFTGEITEKNGLFYAKIQGRHNTEKKSGNIDISIPPVTLVKGVHTLDEIVPLSAEYVTDAYGTIGADIHAAWVKNGKWTVANNGQLFLKQFTGSVRDNPIGDVNAVLKFDSLYPPVLNTQKIAVGSINVGLPLTNGVVAASLDANRVFTLHQAEWELAKGKISSTPFAIKLGELTTDATLTATRLDLPELFRIAPMEGLDATGTVNGTLPLQIRQGKVSLVNGVLEAEGPGAVRYNPKEVPGFLKGSDKQLIDLRVALKAFEFDSLKITLNGEIGKSQKIGLQIKGKNPEFYEGHAVSLNLNVEGPLENVLRYNPGSSRIPDSIKKQLEEYEARNKGGKQ